VGGKAYPATRAYLDGLPDGLASFPECQAKASLLRDMVASRPIAPNAATLPAELCELIRNPPPLSSWIPEVAFNAASMAMYDEHFGSEDTARFEDWVFDFNRDLFRKPLYRILFLLISPRRLLTNVASRWGAFHRGTSLSLIEIKEGAGRLRLEYPSGVFAEPMLYAFSAAWRAAIDTAGGSKVGSKLDDRTDTWAEFTVHWD
jgi:hypothetical protein